MTTAPATYRRPCPVEAPALFLASAPDGRRWLEVHADGLRPNKSRPWCWEAAPATSRELVEALRAAVDVLREEDLDVVPEPRGNREKGPR